MDVSVRIAIQRQRIKFETFLNEELTLIDPWVSSRPLNVTACPVYYCPNSNWQRLSDAVGSMDDQGHIAPR